MAAFIAPLIQAAISRSTKNLGANEAQALHNLYGTQAPQQSSPYGATAPAMTPQPYDPNTVGAPPTPEPQPSKGRRLFGMPTPGSGTG